MLAARSPTSSDAAMPMPAIRRRRGLLPLTLLVLAAASAPAAAQAPAAPAPAASAADLAPVRTLRQEVAAAVQAAQALLAEGKGAEALAPLAQADAVADRTAWETWVIERTRALAAQRAGDAALSLKALEAALLTRQAEPAEETRLVEVLVNLATAARDYPRVIRWAQRYDELQGPSDGVRVMRIQAQANTGDEAGARAALQQRLAAADAQGRALPESHLRLLLGLQQRAKEPTVRTLERLVASYPRPEYWSDLVADAARTPGLPDRALLELFRLMRATRSLSTDDLHLDMAQLSLRAGQPGEAQAILEEGYAAGLLGKGAQAAEHGRLRDQARRAAAADKADRPAAEAAARRAADGTALVALGWSMVAAAAPGTPPTELQAGLDLIEQGFAKGGLQRASEAQLHRGIAQLAAGRKEAATAALGELAARAGTDPLAPAIRLWSLYARAPQLLPARQ
jgi:hypothetical protein